MVRLKGASEIANMLRAYRILVDGQEVGVIRRGGEVTFDVAPGPHQMWLRIDWAQSNTIEFVSDGSPLEFECGSNFAGWKAFLGVRHAVSSSPGYLWLRSSVAPAG